MTRRREPARGRKRIAKRTPWERLPPSRGARPVLAYSSSVVGRAPLSSAFNLRSLSGSSPAYSATCSAWSVRRTIPVFGTVKVMSFVERRGGGDLIERGRHGATCPRRRGPGSERGPRLPVELSGVLALRADDAVATAVRLVAQVRAAAHDPVGARRRAGAGRAGRCAGSSRGRTSRRTTPRRCRSCCAARTRWAGRRRRVPCRRSRRPPCCAAGTSPGTRSSGAGRRARGRRPTGTPMPRRPPRAAYSHSASVGSRVPLHAQ